MSHYPGYNGPPPPPYHYGPPPPWHPHHHHPHGSSPHTYPSKPDGSSGTAPQSYPSPHDGSMPPYPYYVPGTIMMPVPVASMPMPMPPPPPPEQNPTYVTNYIYHGETVVSETPAIGNGTPIELSGEFDWVPTTSTTASYLTGRAVVGGHEGWDGSPLWVIRSWYQGDLIPGKFSIRHTSASIAHDGKEIPVQNMDVLVARPESLRWLPASNGNIPPGAIPAGKTSSGEPLYVGRGRHQLSLTPGKIHPSHGSCYIAFAGSEVAVKQYDVLCRIS